MDKPPLGVMPEKLWLQDRISCLLRALHEYQHKRGRVDLMRKMADELARHLAALEEAEKGGEIDGGLSLKKSRFNGSPSGGAGDAMEESEKKHD